MIVYDDEDGIIVATGSGLTVMTTELLFTEPIVAITFAVPATVFAVTRPVTGSTVATLESLEVQDIAELDIILLKASFTVAMRF